MISTKYASIIAVATFVAGSFVASPELRAFAANTVGSADIINESILSVDIKNGEVKTDDIAPSAIGSLRIKDNDVKAQDLATDSVGGAELQGVTKLLFGQCVLTSAENSVVIGPGTFVLIHCTIGGVDSDDSALAVVNSGSSCFEVTRAEPKSGEVEVTLKNDCPGPAPVGNGRIGVTVFDK